MSFDVDFHEIQLTLSIVSSALKWFCHIYCPNFWINELSRQKIWSFFVGHCTDKIICSDWMLNNHKIFLCIFRIEISNNVPTRFVTHVHLCTSPLRWATYAELVSVAGSVILRLALSESHS